MGLKCATCDRHSDDGWTIYPANRGNTCVDCFFDRNRGTPRATGAGYYFKPSQQALLEAELYDLYGTNALARSAPDTEFVTFVPVEVEKSRGTFKYRVREYRRLTLTADEALPRIRTGWPR